LAFAVGLAASWALLPQPGVVGLIHDWNTYPFAAQHLEGWREVFNGWYEWGLGEPVVYPTEYPLQFATALFAGVHVTGAMISKVIVFSAPAIAFYAMLRYVRALGVPSLAAYFSGFIYACCPVVLNKLVSGQAAYLFGYACIPFFALAVFRALSLRAPYHLVGAVVAGAALALVTMQIQLGILSVYLLLLIVLTTQAPVYTRISVFIITLGTLGLCELATFVGLHVGFETLMQQSPLTIEGADWFRVQSVDPWEAIRLAGYFAHFDALAVSRYSLLWVISAWGIICTAVIGLAVAPRRTRYVAVAMCLLLFPLIMGSKSIVGWYVQNIVLAVPLLGIFRELYHLMAGVAFVYALLCAYALTWFLQQKSRIWLCWIAVACLAIYISPVLRGNAGGLLHTYTFDRYLAPAFARENRGATRAAWFPIDQPLAFDGVGTGVDPMSVTRRGSLWLYRLSWPLTVVDTYARTGDPRLKPLLERLSVGDAIYRPRFTSKFPEFSVDPVGAAPLFRRRIDLSTSLGRGVDVGQGVLDFQLPDVQPKASFASAIALMPRSAAAWLSLNRQWAAVPLDVQPPAGLPYTLFFAKGDLPEEILIAARLSQSLVPFTSVDARRGFAPISLWWWLHPQYADTPSGLLALGREVVDLRVDERGPAVLIYAWRCSPYGGRFEIIGADFRRTIDTWCASAQDRSQSVDVYDTLNLEVRSIDPLKEVLLRGVSVVPVPKWNTALSHWKQLERGSCCAQTPRGRPSVRAPEKVLVFNEGFNEGWKLEGASEHLPSLIGTNIYVVPSNARIGAIRYSPGPAFRWSAIIGLLVLITGLALYPSLNTPHWKRNLGNGAHEAAN